MAEDELDTFRKRWREELKKQRKGQGAVSASSSSFSSSWAAASGSDQDQVKSSYFDDSKENFTRTDHTVKSGCAEDERRVSEERGKVHWRDSGQPDYVCIAHSLLDGRTSPLLDRIQEEKTRRKRKLNHNINTVQDTPQQEEPPQRKDKTAEKLLDQLIQDLNDVNDIPFFDIELPYELALKIFQYLNCAELGRCAQVSRAWRVLAEDAVLWFRICTSEGFHVDAGVSDSPCWKSTLRDCRKAARTVCSNWKNRVGSISQLQFELGKVLVDVSSMDRFVLSGYTSGDVRLWDTLHWDSSASYLKTSSSFGDSWETRPAVTHVQVNSTVAAAAFHHGSVDVWSLETGGEPILHYQVPAEVQSLSLSPDCPVLASVSQNQVRLDQADDHGYWRMLCCAQLNNAVDSLVLVPGRAQQLPLAALTAGDAVFLLDHQGVSRTLHSVYGHPVTCLDASHSLLAFGVKRSGWMEHDGGNRIHVYSLETGRPVVTVGSSPGVFSCVNLRDAPAHLLVCGNKDRRVTTFDLRTGSCVASLYGHQLGVTAVQADEWKVVSGGAEGLVCVWETRMRAKLWEMHNRHPVRHIHFQHSSLLTANIPDDKSPRGACITDDDLTAHRRHRGVICHYDFSEASAVQDHVLPVCRSDYSETSGYNYNIGLTVPYDRLAAQ